MSGGKTPEDRFVEGILGPERRSLSERIEAAYDRAMELRKAMMQDLLMVRVKEQQAKLEHADEWASAKNSEVRGVLLAGWLASDEHYEAYKDNYEGHRDRYRLAHLEIERLRLLVEAAKAEGGRA